MDRWLLPAASGTGSSSSSSTSRHSRDTDTAQCNADARLDKIDTGQDAAAARVYSVRYKPYSKQPQEKRVHLRDRDKIRGLVAPLIQDGAKPSSAALTKHLLKTLKDDSNPITHSDIYDRSDTVVSCTTGHQVGDRSHMRSGSTLRNHITDRREKLAVQHRHGSDSSASASIGDRSVLAGTRIYIDGYVSIVTDIDLKHIISVAGGQVLNAASGATHIVTSQQLNGSKTQKLLVASRTRTHVVKPEWVLDSVNAGKRLAERTYSVLKNNANGSISDAFAHVRSKSTTGATSK